MRNSISRWPQANGRVLLGAWRVSRQGVSQRLSTGFLELLPQGLFYFAHAVIIFIMFRAVGGEVIGVKDLVIFLLIMSSIDSMGDALMFKGLNEYIRSLRRGQTLYYLLSPGAPLAKVLFFRWDMPMLLFGAAASVIAIALSWFWYGVSPLLMVGCLFFGTLTHMVLTSAFHVIQAYFDTTMPIPFGSPASRFYTKPMHLFMGSSVTLTIMMTIYPVYFITAFPAGLATQRTVGYLTQYPLPCYGVGVLSLFIWILILNRIIKKSCQMRQN